MKPKKLIWQIYPATLFVVLAAMVAVTWYGSGVFKGFYLEEAEKDLEARANLIKSRVYDYVTKSNYVDLRSFSKEAGRESGTRITIIDKQGLVLADSNENPTVMDNHARRPEIVEAYDWQRGRSLRYSKTLGENMLYIAIPLQGSHNEPSDSLDGAVQTVIRVAMPVTALDRTIQHFRLRVLLGCIIIVIGAALVALFISRNISRSLEEMTLSAAQFAKGDFSQRMSPQLASTASLEVAELATSMDRMAEMLDEKIKTIVTHRNQLETVFSSMVESVIAIDRGEKIISINTAAANLFGVRREVAQGKFMQEIIRHSQLLEHIQATLDTEENIEDEIILQDIAGEKCLQTNVVSLTDGTGASVGVLLVMNDLTNIRKLERIRSDFVANVSHELRTPITSIRGYVETLLDGALESREDSEKFLHIVLRQSERLNAIIDDLLSLSRIEQESKDGRVFLEEGPLCAILDTALQTCQVKADMQEVTLDYDCSEDLMIMMNPTLVEQAVVNLLVNAIQYSKTGDIVTVTARELHGDDKGNVEISVKDTGCGISPEHLPRLFERFYRSDKARSRSHGGTGLGLAIVKHIVQAHGGVVKVQSELGKGSEFTMIFPLKMS
ncbi:ATP-binding protein [Desulfopila sp. IMCC35008]|uniref:sensor histidine kinase n=1 Tax=Desulfopila sp. IMCC35008 TaxID=2653858 RepID=UPI0013D74B6B|nr:ATP-binding protein [Desulfopila sp. IMCC35008]